MFRHATALLQLFTCRWTPNQADRATLLQLSRIFTCRRETTAVRGHRWLIQLLSVFYAFLYVSKEIPQCFKCHEIQQERCLQYQTVSFSKDMDVSLSLPTRAPSALSGSDAGQQPRHSAAPHLPAQQNGSSEHSRQQMAQRDQKPTFSSSFRSPGYFQQLPVGDTLLFVHEKKSYMWRDWKQTSFPWLAYSYIFSPPISFTRMVYYSFLHEF